jgi:excisionase family DNA binding protein
MPFTSKNLAPEERFWLHTQELENGCIEWRGHVRQSGYGLFCASGFRPVTMVHAHRYAYSLAFGKIPDGWHVHHICGNRRCVNPEHLQALGVPEHAAIEGAKKRNKPFCINGHPRTPETVRETVSGLRGCRLCKQEAERKCVSLPQLPEGIGAEDLMTVKDAEVVLGRPNVSIRRLIRTGALPAYKPKRRQLFLLRSDVSEFLASARGQKIGQDDE